MRLYRPTANLAPSRGLWKAKSSLRCSNSLPVGGLLRPPILLRLALREATFRRQRKLDCGQTSQLFSIRDARTSALCVYEEIFFSYNVLSIVARAFFLVFFCASP